MVEEVVSEGIPQFFLIVSIHVRTVSVKVHKERIIQRK